MRRFLPPKLNDLWPRPAPPTPPLSAPFLARAVSRALGAGTGGGAGGCVSKRWGRRYRCRPSRPSTLSASSTFFCADQGSGALTRTRFVPLPSAPPFPTLHGRTRRLNRCPPNWCAPSHHASFSFSSSQSAVVADGFRSLREGEPVEFSIDTADGDGRAKAADVTGPGGAAPQVRREGRRGERRRAPVFF